MDDYIIERVKKKSAIFWLQNFLFGKNLHLEIPPAHITADLSLSLFDLAKEFKQDPKKLAEESAGIINKSKNDFIESAQAFGPYLNINFKKQKIYSLLLKEVSKLKDKFGQNDLNAKKVAVIDYSGPNIAKPIGVGHLRSTVIGQALVNIYEATGYRVIKDNHLGTGALNSANSSTLTKSGATKRK